MNFKKIIKTSLVLLSLSILILFSVISYEVHKQNIVIKELLSKNLDGYLIPHKINNIHKLNSILYDNIRSFELDLNFYSVNGNNYFEIGHNKSTSDGYILEDYLKLVKNKKIKKIWLDVKNVSKNNIHKILNRLDYLDKKYHIKKISIFETPTRIKELKLISDAGYHTSHYLPYSLSFPIVEQNKKILQWQINDIVNLINTQNLKAISFDSDLYSFVKKYIEPNISKNIVYHTWTGHRIRHKEEYNKLKHEPYYNDPRVKTIIYAYYHPLFHNIIQKIL